MLGSARGRWTQGMKGEAAWALAGGEEGAKGLPGALLSTQEPPPAPSPVHHVPVLAVSPLSPTWSGLSSAKERWRGCGKGLGRGSLPAQQRRAGLGHVFGGEAAPTARGRQEKASKEELDAARPGTGHTGTLRGPGHAVRAEQLFRSLSHIWRRLLPQQLALEGRAMTGSTTSHPTPSPVCEGRGTSTNHNSLRPRGKGVRAADDSGTSTSKLG